MVCSAPRESPSLALALQRQRDARPGYHEALQRLFSPAVRATIHAYTQAVAAEAAARRVEANRLRAELGREGRR